MRCPDCLLYEAHAIACAARLVPAGIVLEPARGRITRRGASIYVTPIKVRLLGKLLRANTDTVSVDAMRPVAHRDEIDGGMDE